MQMQTQNSFLKFTLFSESTTICVQNSITAAENFNRGGGGNNLNAPTQETLFSNLNAAAASTSFGENLFQTSGSTSGFNSFRPDSGTGSTGNPATGASGMDYYQLLELTGYPWKLTPNLTQGTQRVSTQGCIPKPYQYPSCKFITLSLSN